MDRIVTTALVGTTRQAQVDPTTGTPVDALLDGLSGYADERKLLLSAGAWAVYRQAGQQPQQILAVPEPAAPETLRACSSAATLLLERLLQNEDADLRLEALQRLREVGVHIPHRLLPLALTKIHKGQQTALLPVLGEHGRWLSQFNSSWSWVHDFLSTDDSSLPAEAETLWQEGAAPQRVEVLRRLRAVDPAKALTWLEGVWKQEKANLRCDLLSTLEIGLTVADEAFLESALDDRAPSVRLVAINLLAHIPTSAFIERMCVRGRAILTRSTGTIDVTVPATFGKDWQRDGIVEKSSSHFGKRAWWLIQILGAVPPTFWETHLGAEPTELLRRLPDNEWKFNVIDGWSKAVLLYHASDWFRPLWDWWQEHPEQLTQYFLTDADILEKLIQAMPQQEAESIVVGLWNDERHSQENTWTAFLPALPKPWSIEFGQAYLRFSRTYYQQQKGHITGPHPALAAWLDSLFKAARALPVACLAEAQQDWEPLDEGLPWYIQQINNTMQSFVETMHTRQKIYEEII